MLRHKASQAIEQAISERRTIVRFELFKPTVWADEWQGRLWVGGDTDNDPDADFIHLGPMDELSEADLPECVRAEFVEADAEAHEAREELRGVLTGHSAF